MNPRLQKLISAASQLQPTVQAAVRIPGGIGSTTPSPMNAGDALQALSDAFDKRVDQIKPGKSVQLRVAQTKPKSVQEVFEKPLNYAGSTPPSAEPGININPNADRSYLAHEMGHIASQQTDIGHLIASLRENPNLSKVLAGATIGIPVITSAIEEGDNDLDTALATSILASAPVIADEALASKNALAIMNHADMRATLGQRGRLAGGLMNYLAAPVIAGIAGNAVGNMLD